MYNCPICKNEQVIFYKDENGQECVKPCQCQKIRRALYLAEESGLGELLSIYTFERFKTDCDYQKDLYNKAKEYIEDKDNKWFTVFGKTGSGKTMICTSICGELLKQGCEVRFMSWIEESRKLKACVNENTYDEIIEPLKNAEVLYIDDFFKAENNTMPSNADIKLANEILNYRYNKAKMSSKLCKTLISSERTLHQLINYDEAIAGRIVENSEKYLIALGDKAINYRLKNFV